MNRLALINSSNYKAPPTPYGLVYAPDLPGLQTKIVFYKVVNDSLQWSEDWGETWYEDGKDYIVWTVDQYTPTANLIANKITLQQVIDNIPNNVARAPSAGIASPKGIPWDSFTKGFIDLYSGSEVWGLARGYLGGSGRTYPIIENIEVNGVVNLSAIFNIQNEDITITVTKYVS